MPIKVILSGPPLADTAAALVISARMAAAPIVGPQIVAAVQGRLRTQVRAYADKKPPVTWKVDKWGTLRVTVNNRYAAAWERGGIIVPGHGRYLLLPFHGVRPDDSMKTFVFKTASGKLIVMRDMGRGRPAIPVGHLVRQIRLPHTDVAATVRGFRPLYDRVVAEQFSRLAAS